MKKLINIAQVILECNLWGTFSDSSTENLHITTQIFFFDVIIFLMLYSDQMLLFNGMVCPINVSPNAVVISINDNRGFVFKEYVVK